MFKRSVLCLLGLFQILFFLAAVVKPAHAYVDPGSGLLVFQVGGSMLAGALFVLRTKIRKLFGRNNTPKAEEDLKDYEPNAGTGTRA
jgi:hypothetical protein